MARQFAVFLFLSREENEVNETKFTTYKTALTYLVPRDFLESSDNEELLILV